MALPNPIAPPHVVSQIPVSSGNNRISSFGPGAVGAQQQSAVTDTQQVNVVLPPGATIRVPVSGISFYFPSIKSPLGITARALNAGQSRSFGQYFQGTGLRFGTSGFNSVELVNPDVANQNTVLVVIGGGIPNNTYDEFIDKRVIVTNNPSSNVLVQSGLTFAVGFRTRTPAWAETLGAGATQLITDGYLGKSRKQLIICNNDPGANLLLVQDVAGNPIGTIQPSTAFTFEGNGSVNLNNPNGGGVLCNIGETYYS